MSRRRSYLSQYRISDMIALLRNGFAKPRECPDPCAGKTVVVTGATSGIGLETARLYASRGADLVLVNRNEGKSDALRASLSRDFGVRCDHVIADFADLAQAKEAARRLSALERVDVLIHNAGIFSTKKLLSADGIELVFQVDHLASFVMNCLLMDRLKAWGRTRVLLVNSEGHRFALSGVHADDLGWERRRYTGLRSYGAAKTAQLLAMRVFSRRLEGSGVTINAMHPGNVVTSIGQQNEPSYRRMKKLLIDPLAFSPEVSAKALYFLGVSPEVADANGKYFNLTTEARPAPHALDDGAAEEIWEKSAELGGL